MCKGVSKVIYPLMFYVPPNKYFESSFWHNEHNTVELDREKSLMKHEL